ncbi:MAG TPA: hypothetical protein VI055_20420 [Rubrobacter sp.]|jgi:hypothetical protein
MRRWAREWIKESVALGPNKRLAPGHSCRGVLGGAHVLAVGPEQEDEIRDYERLA